MNGWHRLWIVGSVLWLGVLAVLFAPAVIDAAYESDLIRTMLLIWAITSVAALALGYGIAWALRGFRKTP